MKQIVDLSVSQLIVASLFVWICLGLVRWLGVAREKEILVASIRMTLQLILTGYVLVAVFEYPSPWISLLSVLVMEWFAVSTVIKRFDKQIAFPLKRAMACSMFLGTLGSIAVFQFGVLNVTPWFNPRYFIPVSGMLIGNSMTGIALGAKTLVERMQLEKRQIEERLMLGATPFIATRECVRASFESAIVPTLNAMLGMGVVFLPGMMTGQILSGTSPQTAISYQIAIMFGILGAVALSVMLMLQWGVRTFFNAQAQLIEQTPSEGQGQ
jgi:putative ABC transport system permease protein